ncbi:hypothetical protein [Salmonella phage SD-6_S16]|nr:hypothetical protein [Salmonella phage SD-6_S16]
MCAIEFIPILDEIHGVVLIIKKCPNDHRNSTYNPKRHAPMNVIKSPRNNAGKGPKNNVVQEKPKKPSLRCPTFSFFKEIVLAIFNLLLFIWVWYTVHKY